MPDRGAQRKANFFKGTMRDPARPGQLTIPTEMPTDRQHVPPVTGEPISDRDKLELIERHITAFEATLPPGQLSPGDKTNIRSKAMLGGSSPSAVMVSVMQAAAVAKPSLQQPAVNYYSSAAGVDAATAERVLGAGAKLGAGGYLGEAFARGSFRDRGMFEGSSDSGQGGLSGLAVANFGVSNGAVSGMTQQLYRDHFQPIYGANQQGQFTATRVANILGNNEGLSGAALVRRTKEVGHDTRDRLGLDTNIFAPKVANIGKKYSDPIIEHKGLLDQALIEQQRGNQAASDALMRKYYEESRTLQERARVEDPSKANDVSAVIKGAFAAVVERGLKPTEVQASMLKFEGNRNDPIAVAQHDAMLRRTEETPQGRIAVAAYRADEAKAAQVEAREVATNQATLAARAAGASDLDNLAGQAPAASGGTTAQRSDTQNSAQPVQTASAAPQAITPAPAVASPSPPAAEAKKEETKKIAAAPSGRAAGPV
jgi:hypothetical protein